MKTVSLAAICAAVVGSAALAGDHGAGWDAVDLKKKDGEKTSVEAIVTHAHDAPGMIFVCAGEKLRALVGLAPMDLAETWQTEGQRTRTRKVRLMRADGTTSVSTWAWDRSRNIMQPLKTSDAAKLYNSVIRGESFTISYGRSEPITFSPPKADKTFAKFGAACGLGVDAAGDA